MIGYLDKSECLGAVLTEAVYEQLHAAAADAHATVVGVLSSWALEFQRQ